MEQNAPRYTQADTQTHTVSVAIAASALNGKIGVFLLRIIIIGDQESERRRAREDATLLRKTQTGARRMEIPHRPDDKEMMLRDG